MNEDPLIIDTSYWKKGDKNWEKVRKEKWPLIEGVLSTYWDKNKKSVNVVKRYYFSGELPDWKKINEDWDHKDERDRHLDVTTILWLHPSVECDVLRPLCDAYFKGYGRDYKDVLAGMAFLMDWGVCVASRNGGGITDWTPPFVCFEGKEKLLFDLIYGNVSGLYFEFGEDKKDYPIHGPDLRSLNFSGDWLCHKKLNDHGKHMLMQYDLPLELMFRKINSEPDRISREFSRRRFVFEKSLFRIHHFNAEKEGDSPRATFVTKIRKILDEGDHVPELKQLWEQVKRGEVTVDKPWKL